MCSHVVWCLALTACHVTTSTVIARPERVDHVVNTEAPGKRLPPRAGLGDTGMIHFSDWFECPTEEILTEQRAIEVERRPNLATFIVGVITTAAGGVLLATGLSRDDAANGYTGVGAASLVVGLPLAIGPWIGNGTSMRPLEEVGMPSIGAGRTTRRPGTPQPCNGRPVSEKEATLLVDGFEVYGTIDRGKFAVPPYHLIDVWGPRKALTFTARIGTHTIDGRIGGQGLAERAPLFYKEWAIDPSVAPLRLVPNLVPGTLRVSLATTPDGPAARIVLVIKNDGPGPSYNLRGQVSAPATPQLDGRIFYFGLLASGASLQRELMIPLSAAAADSLRNATIDLSLELRDAHGTAPTTPVRFHGQMLVDAPR